MYYLIELLLLGYFLGVVFSNRPFSFLVKFFKTDFFKEQLDRGFIIITGLITFSVFLYFWCYKNNLTDAIQLGIFLATFFTLAFSVLIKDGPSNYRNRPKIKIHFDDKKTDNYHMTKMENNWKTQNGSLVTGYVSTYYIRLRVENIGNTALKNAQVVLREVLEGKPTNPFFPMNLSWEFAGEVVDIPPKGASRAINIFEIMNPSETYSLLADFDMAGGGPDRERYLQQGVGFRSCTIRPNTLSDVFSAGNYIFQLLISADNLESKVVNIAIDYDKNWITNADINEMRRKYLRVRVKCKTI